MGTIIGNKMPEQIFKITMPPEAKPLGAEQVRSALYRMIQDFEYQVMELCAVPEEILNGKGLGYRNRR